MPDFVASLVEYTKEYESPTSFWKWSAYSAVTSVLRYNVFLQHKIGKIYPNTYTILLADAAKFRKGAPLNLVNSLIQEMDHTKVFSGGGSIQGILDKLSQAIAVKKTGKTIVGGAGLILAEELASFFVEDPKLLPLLTNIYDYKEVFTHDLRGLGFTIKNLCVTMLAASNETHLREVYTGRAVYGGLLRRTLLITPDEVRNPNSLFNPDKPFDLTAEEAKRKALGEMLREIAKLNGEMVITPEAARYWDLWYSDLYRNYDKYGGKSGVIEGIHGLILKITMAIVAARCEMEIKKDDLERAILEVTSLRKNYEVYTMAAGSSNQAQQNAIIISSLWKAPDYHLRKKDIMMVHWNNMTSEEFDAAATTLLSAGMIENLPKGNEPGFVLTKQAVTSLESRIGGKKP